MAGSGSILGNAVLRLEDPTLLTGEGKYIDDLVEPGMLHVSYVRSSVAHGNLVSVDITDAASMPGVVAVYHGGGDDLGLPSFQGFAMMPAALNRPIFATTRCASSVTSWRPSSPKPSHRPVDAADAVIVEYQPLPVVNTPMAGLDVDAPLLFPEHGSNVCFGTDIGQDVGSARGRRCRRRGDDGESANRRCADREQRCRRRTRRRRAHDVGVAPGAALDPRLLRADARARAGEAARRVPVGRRRVRARRPRAMSSTSWRPRSRSR